MTTPARRPVEETGRLGDEIYERDIRHLVEADHHGEFVAIDVESGDYAIADSVLAAADRLRAQRPYADGWLVRIGHPTPRTFGGRSLQWTGDPGRDEPLLFNLYDDASAVHNLDV